MPYPEIMIRPMREDLTRFGVEELKTPDAGRYRGEEQQGNADGRSELDLRLRGGKARPGVALALNTT